MKFIQINFHHRKAGTAVLFQKPADTALIQEPCVHEAKGKD
jgi:hypothetical protein